MRTFRIATYNIHKGRGMDGRVRIERILRVLREVEADIIALQGDPTKDITAVRRVMFVMKSGRVYKNQANAGGSSKPSKPGMQ